MLLTKKEIASFQEKIFSWWATQKRDLPWRHTHDPYKILVSEVMLQQTQVSRGLPKYLEFLKAFPSIEKLAHASPAQVLRIWKGMGYNRRALYLQKTAETVLELYKGKFPDTEQELLKLPGLGSYTARAVLVFAFKKDIAMIDTNIRQILTYHFFGGKHQSEKEIQNIADQLIPEGKSWEWHQALMDYGALVLDRKKIEKVKKVIKPFKESNRYFRGRMMDLVREKRFLERNLITDMIRRYGKDKEFMENILQTLLHDGLLSRSQGGIICLPE